MPIHIACVLLWQRTLYLAVEHGQWRIQYEVGWGHFNDTINVGGGGARVENFLDKIHTVASSQTKQIHMHYSAIGEARCKFPGVLTLSLSLSLSLACNA